MKPVPINIDEIVNHIEKTWIHAGPYKYLEGIWHWHQSHYIDNHKYDWHFEFCGPDEQRQQNCQRHRKIWGKIWVEVNDNPHWERIK